MLGSRGEVENECGMEETLAYVRRVRVKGRDEVRLEMMLGWGISVVLVMMMSLWVVVEKKQTNRLLSCFVA